MSGPTRVAGNGKPAGDWEDDGERFRRPRRPVEVRRRAPWKRVLSVGGRGALGLVVMAAVAGLGFLAYGFVTRGELFRVANLEAVAVVNSEHVPVEAVRELFAADVGRSVFAVPLEVRRQSVEGIPWVEAAAVSRLLPHGLWVHVRERVPVGFLRQGATLWLIDSAGVILPLPEGATYNFPVLSGLSESFSPEERRQRIQFYLDFISDLDRDGKEYSARFSEVDLSDADDLRATVTEPDGAVWLHFGRDRYQEKFEAFLQHRALWEQNGDAVRSVDLRYRGQIVLNPDLPARTGSR